MYSLFVTFSDKDIFFTLRTLQIMNKELIKIKSCFYENINFCTSINAILTRINIVYCNKQLNNNLQFECLYCTTFDKNIQNIFVLFQFDDDPE